jgi:DNA repair ATPase RecN
MRGGFDGVVVTDHNTGAWIDRLKEALAELKEENPPGFRMLYLFPGVEISVSSGIHVLAILSPDKRTADIDSLLGAVGFMGDKGKTDSVTTKSPLEVIDIISKAGGIAVPAHVDKENGLFKLSKQIKGPTLEQLLKNKDIIAMELIDQNAEKPKLYYDHKINWTEILGSDAHHPSGSKSTQSHFPGSHFTWVKMGEPNLEGLRLALLDGPLSIKRSDSFTGSPNEYEHPVIGSMAVNNARYMGRGETFTCKFNPWLNTIIGGRGTGKSTLLEFLRITLRRDEELPGALQEDFKKYRLQYNWPTDEGLLTGDAEFTAAYRKIDAKFLIQWSVDGSEEPILEEKEDGSRQAAVGDIAGRFPVRIYSQKQIFELARRPQALLKIIDDDPAVKFRQWEEDWNALQSRFLTLKAQVREIEASLKDEPRLKGELDDIRRKIEAFEQADHAEIRKNYQRRRRQRRELENWEESWTGSGDKIRELAETILPLDIDRSLFDPGQDVDDRACLESIHDVYAKLSGIADRLNAAASDIDQMGSDWEKTKDKSTWNNTIHNALDKYEQLVRNLENKGIKEGAGEYGRLVQQRQALEEQLKTLESKRENFASLQRQADARLTEMESLRKELTGHRENFLAAVLENNPYVKINVIPYGDKDSVENEFRKIINRDQGSFERDIGTPEGSEGLLAKLYKSLSPGTSPADQNFEQELDKLKAMIAEIRKGDDSKVHDRRFATHIRDLPPDNFDRLDCWFPKDSLEVEYSERKGSGFKPVKQGSPGQKTAALLAFILSYGKEPLILDQPEDDLDNHLIYDLIVTQLRKIKQKRQVIVVTHDANIVVNGDAENVIALDVRGGQTRIICQGSLQEKEVRDEICRVLEGGKEAFDLRYKRIGAGGANV